MNGQTKFPSHRIIADSIKAIEAEADHDKRRHLITVADRWLRSELAVATREEFDELKKLAHAIDVQQHRHYREMLATCSTIHQEEFPIHAPLGEPVRAEEVPELELRS